MDKENRFPKVVKSIENYLTDEEGNITRNKIVTVGSLAIILSMIYSMDVLARHGSHKSHSSHSSHSSTSYIRTHTNHVSHSDHHSHSSHTSSTSNHSSNYSAVKNSGGSGSTVINNHPTSQMGTIKTGTITETGLTGSSISVAASTIQTLVETTSGYDCIYNEAYYIMANPDVYAVFGNDTAAIFQHFLDFGMSEGRIGSPEFNVVTYKSYYADLVSAFGDDLKSYYIHYMDFGKAEGRIGY